MKLILKLTVCVLLAGMLFHLSCTKEYSCENCQGTNHPPIAKAGPDQVIILPTDSVMLDGSASSDPDGTISSFEWRKISGPLSSTVNNVSAAGTVVKGLSGGVYRFELKVTDNGGLSAHDTVQVTVNDLLQPNRPPVAIAGADQIITLPTNTTNLDGSASTDPDNNITGYSWTKISGPSFFSIVNANIVQTPVTNLVVGVYQIELKVTDAGGLISKDTIQVIVNPEPPPAATCNPVNRPLINAQLVPVGMLSVARDGVVAGSAGNKILFAGGIDFTDNPGFIYSTVDIYDISTNSWSIANLSQQRHAMGVAVLGNKIFFAGGLANLSGNPAVVSPGTPTTRIDIYDASNNTWSTAELSEPRYLPQGAAANGKVLFAGGTSGQTLQGDLLFSNRVDLYDASASAWSTASLSQARTELTTSVVGNNIYFAGGTILYNPVDYGSTSRIDIYNASNNSWSTSSLSSGKGAHAGIAVNNKVYWAGGRGDGCANYNGCCIVEIRDVNAQVTSFANLFQPNAYFSAVLKDNKIIFFTGAGSSIDKFDIYDISTNTWSIGVLTQDLYSAAIISVNNTVFVAGAYANSGLSHQVWKLEF